MTIYFLSTSQALVFYIFFYMFMIYLNIDIKDKNCFRKVFVFFHLYLFYLNFF